MKFIISKLAVLFIPNEENSYKPRFLEGKFLFRYFLFLLALKLVILVFFFYFPKTLFFADITKTALIEMTNQERQAMDLPLLKENVVLDEAAYAKAQDMLKNGYFSHFSPSGISPWSWFISEGYNYQSAGENLAIGFIDSEEVIDAWKKSPSHNENLLSPKFQEVGIAVLTGEFEGSETTIVVQHFGSPIIPTKEGVIEMEIETETKNKEETSTPVISGQEDLEKVVMPEVEEEKEEKSSETVLGTQAGEEKNFSPIASFMAFTYADIVEALIFYSLIFVIVALLLNLFVKIRIQDKRLILKTVIFIVILILFIWSDKEVLIRIIPHNLIII